MADAAGTAGSATAGSQASGQASGAAASPALNPAAMMTVPKAGDFWLTTTHAGEAQRYPHMARLANGSYVAVRANFATPGSGIVLMQAFDAGGNPSGAETSVAEGQSPGVTSFPDGSFLVTWVVPPPTFALSFPVYGQRFDASGQPIGARLSLGYYADDAQPAAVSADTFILGVIAQLGHVNGPAGSLAGFSLDGSTVLTTPALQEDPCGINGTPAVTALPGGGFVAAWPYQCVGNPQIVLRRYDAAGNFTASRFDALSMTGTPSLATLSNGTVVVAWTMADGINAPSARALLLGATLPASAGGAIAVPAQGGRTPLAVSAVTAGGFVIPWSATGPAEATVPVSRYSNDGTPM
ncbi:hypothetical protein [Ramlibacter humi]|uniref:Uncharacterized protein n=1 Tax=Ramlibacter humi TaxID=2530451 RepID=A0A4Z0BEX6_9BURK|nr:hypothetical protein [Ramlibacter humi]TFY96664.1 hypothetical protein EZ216_19975 [Ramlibacter humi]